MHIDIIFTEYLVHIGTGTTKLVRKPRHGMPLFTELLLDNLSYVHSAIKKAQPFGTYRPLGYRQVTFSTTSTNSPRPKREPLNACPCWVEWLAVFNGQEQELKAQTPNKCVNGIAIQHSYHTLCVVLGKDSARLPKHQISLRESSKKHLLFFSWWINPLKSIILGADSSFKSLIPHFSP